MQLLSDEHYSALREGARVLEKDEYGDKVLHLTDGTFLKIFRRKRLLSKNLFLPPARRFAINAAELSRLGIPCPNIIALYKMNQPYRSLVHYEPLQGTTLRDMLDNQSPAAQEALFARLKVFITHLHDLGVYFRSLHLGNIVETPAGELGLIDISDMRCLNKPLSVRLRKRNYQHLFRYQDDWAKVHPCARVHFQY